MAVAQCARELQAPVDPHADALAQQLLGSHGRTELAGALGFMADLVEAALYRSPTHPPRWSPGVGGQRKPAVRGSSPRPGPDACVYVTRISICTAPCYYLTSVRKKQLDLESVGNQDSQDWLVVIQATDGPTYFDRRPMGKDGAAVPGQAGRSRAQRQ